MRYQLSIRHNIRLVAEPFLAGAIHTYDAPLVRVGSGSQCECRLEEPEFAAVHFPLRQDSAAAAVLLEPQPGAEVFVNQVAAVGPARLSSGDEVRVGHWTLRFHKLHAPAHQASAFDGLTLLAKVLVALILVAEGAIVILLPHRLRSQRLWQEQIARQKTVMLLDRLRDENSADDAADALERNARRLVAQELDAVARYLRTNERRLTRAQWNLLYQDLLGYSQILARVEDGTVLRPAPALAADAAVRALLAGPLGGRAGEP